MMTSQDEARYHRALRILEHMALERTGWRSFFRRWHINHEPLRHDAANLVREAGGGLLLPNGTHLVGDDE